MMDSKLFLYNSMTKHRREESSHSGLLFHCRFRFMSRALEAFLLAQMPSNSLLRLEAKAPGYVREPKRVGTWKILVFYYCWLLWIINPKRHSYTTVRWSAGFVFVCLLVCLPVGLFVCLFVCQFVCLSVCLLVSLFVCLFVCLSVCLLVSLFACLSVCMFVC